MGVTLSGGLGQAGFIYCRHGIVVGPKTRQAGYVLTLSIFPFGNDSDLGDIAGALEKDFFRLIMELCQFLS